MKDYSGCIGYQEGVVPSPSNKVSWSISELFGKIPVEPKVFEKLDPRLKWFGDCLEGNTFCTSCGTLTCDILYSHHPDCCNYKSIDECAEYEEYKTAKLGTEDARMSPFKMKIHQGKLVIEMGLDSLCCAVQMQEFWDEDAKIVDSYEFVRDMITELEDDRNSCSIYSALDNAAKQAVEDGSLGIEYKE